MKKKLILPKQIQNKKCEHFTGTVSIIFRLKPCERMTEYPKIFIKTEKLLLLTRVYFFMSYIIWVILYELYIFMSIYLWVILYELMWLCWCDYVWSSEMIVWSSKWVPIVSNCFQCQARHLIRHLASGG